MAILQQDNNSARLEKAPNWASALGMLCSTQRPGSMGALSQEQQPPHLAWDATEMSQGLQ